MSAFRSYFQFFKKRPKGHFRGQFQKYSALKVVYWVIEFWPYLSWFWSKQHFSEILQVCSNLTKLDQGLVKEAKRKEAQRFASQRPLHCARFLELNCVQKAACFSTVVFTFEWKFSNCLAIWKLYGYILTGRSFRDNYVFLNLKNINMLYSNPSFIAGVTFRKWPAISEIREIENLLKTY